MKRKKIWKTRSKFKQEAKNLRLYEEEMEDKDEDIPAPAGGWRFARLNANVQNVIFMVSLLRLNWSLSKALAWKAAGDMLLQTFNF